MVDVVFGLRASAAAEQSASVVARLASSTEQPPLGATQSLMFAGSYAFADTLHLGVRTAVTIASGEAAGVGLAALSNTELEAEHPLHLADDTDAALGLGLILPTALGHEPDPEAMESGNLHSDLSEATAAARGFEDGALFRAEHVGLIPKLRVAHHSGKLRLESQIKLENLLSVRSAPHHRYLGELVVAGFYGYDLFEPLTLGIRVWSNIMLDQTDEASLVCEPQVQVHGAHVQGLVGALIPLVQRTDAPTGPMSVRLAAAALF